jgi:hypothetical protein
MEAISSSKTLAYFKYTPVKAIIKINGNTHLCYLQSISPCHAHKLLLLQMIQVNLTMFPVTGLGGLQDVEKLTLSALCTDRTLFPRDTVILMFQVLISVRGLGKSKNSPHHVSNLRPSSL